MLDGVQGKLRQRVAHYNIQGMLNGVQGRARGSSAACHVSGSKHQGKCWPPNVSQCTQCLCPCLLSASLLLSFTMYIICHQGLGFTTYLMVLSAHANMATSPPVARGNTPSSATRAASSHMPAWGAWGA